MKIINSGLFQLVILACIVPSAFPTIIEPPRDTAALVDSHDVKLNCSVTPGSAFKWETVVGWNLMNQFIYSSGIGPVTNHNYTVAPDGSSISINRLTPGLANIYICSDPQILEAARVAAMSKLSCNQPNNILTVSAGKSFPFNCSISYHSNFKLPLKPLTPTLSIMAGKWSTPVATDRAKEPGLFYLSKIITATPKMDNTDVICKLYFENDSSITDSITKGLPPLYEDSCSFTLKVIQEVTVARIETDINNASNVVHLGHNISNIEGRDSRDMVSNGEVGQGLKPRDIGFIVGGILLFLIILVAVIVLCQPQLNVQPCWM